MGLGRWRVLIVAVKYLQEHDRSQAKPISGSYKRCWNVNVAEEFTETFYARSSRLGVVAVSTSRRGSISKWTMILHGAKVATPCTRIQAYYHEACNVLIEVLIEPLCKRRVFLHELKTSTPTPIFADQRRTKRHCGRDCVIASSHGVPRQQPASLWVRSAKEAGKNRDKTCLGELHNDQQC